MCKRTRDLCIKLEIINKLYYDAQSTIYIYIYIYIYKSKHGFIAGRGKRFLFDFKATRVALEVHPASLLFHEYWKHFPQGLSNWNVKMITYLHLMPKSRVLNSSLSYTLMACTGKSLPVYLTFFFGFKFRVYVV